MGFALSKENLLFTICGFLLGLIVGAIIVARVGDVRPFSQPAAETQSASAAAVTDEQREPGADPAIIEMFAQQITTLKKQVELDPTNSDAASQLGNLYMDAGKYGEAITYYRLALKHRRDATVATDLGICLRASGEHEEALRLFREAQQIDPQHWQAVFNEAVVLVDLQRNDEAKAVLARLKALRPNDEQVRRFEQVLSQIR